MGVKISCIYSVFYPAAEDTTELGRSGPGNIFLIAIDTSPGTMTLISVVLGELGRDREIKRSDLAVKWPSTLGQNYNRRMNCITIYINIYILHLDPEPRSRPSLSPKCLALSYGLPTCNNKKIRDLNFACFAFMNQKSRFYKSKRESRYIGYAQKKSSSITFDLSNNAQYLLLPSFNTQH